MRYEFSSDTLDWRQPSYVFDVLSWRSQRQVKLRPFVTTRARCTILRDLLIKMEVKLRVEFGVHSTNRDENSRSVSAFLPSGS